MSSLVQKIIDAHGGLAAWRELETVTAHLRQGGALWGLKGHAGELDETSVTVGVRDEWASHHPFGSDEKVSFFRPDKVEIRGRSGRVLEVLENPRASFAGHTLETRWSEPQLAYFAGIAMWTYLNMPFLLARPGVHCEQLGDWTENGDSWQRLEVTFPEDVATHSRVQTLYVDSAGLLKRHDYDVEIAGNTPGAHYIFDYVKVSKIRFPTRRRIFPRLPDGTVAREPLVVSIDLSDITVR